RAARRHRRVRRRPPGPGGPRARGGRRRRGRRPRPAVRRGVGRPRRRAPRGRRVRRRAAPRRPAGRRRRHARRGGRPRRRRGAAARCGRDGASGRRRRRRRPSAHRRVRRRRRRGRRPPPAGPGDRGPHRRRRHRCRSRHTRPGAGRGRTGRRRRRGRAAGRGRRPRRWTGHARRPPGGPVTALSTPLSRLVGDRTAKALAKLGLETGWDLVRHYPRRYSDPSRLTDFGDLPLGDHVTVNARIVRTSLRPTRKPRTSMLDVTVTDGQGELTLRFFGAHGYLASSERRLYAGRVGLFTGTVEHFGGKRMLKNPGFEFFDAEDEEDRAAALERMSRPTPIYAATAALPTWRIRGAVQTV